MRYTAVCDSPTPHIKIGQAMDQTEVIIRVGTEGGAVSLLGKRRASGWIFARHVLDHTPLMIDEESLEHQSAFVDSWPAALALLSRYPWMEFYPLQVHPEFRQQTLAAIEAACVAGGDSQKVLLQKWIKLLT